MYLLKMIRKPKKVKEESLKHEYNEHLTEEIYLRTSREYWLTHSGMGFMRHIMYQLNIIYH